MRLGKSMLITAALASILLLKSLTSTKSWKTNFARNSLVKPELVWENCSSVIVMCCCKSPCAGISDRIRGLTMATKIAREHNACLYLHSEYFTMSTQRNDLCGTNLEFAVRSWDSDFVKHNSLRNLSCALASGNNRKVLLFTNEVWHDLCDIEGIETRWCSYRGGLMILSRYPHVYAKLTAQLPLARMFLKANMISDFVALHVRVGGSFLDRHQTRLGIPWRDGHQSNTTSSLLTLLKSTFADISHCARPLVLFSDSVRFVAEVQFLLYGKVRIFHCCGNVGHVEQSLNLDIVHSFVLQVLFEFVMMSLSSILFATHGGYGIIGRHYLDYSTRLPLVRCTKSKCLSSSFVPKLVQELACSTHV